MIRIIIPIRSSIIFHRVPERELIDLTAFKTNRLGTLWYTQKLGILLVGTLVHGHKVQGTII